MRFKVVLAVLAIALLATAASAEATAKLPYGLARKWSKQETEQWCREESNCDTWKVFSCHRFSPHRKIHRLPVALATLTPLWRGEYRKGARRSRSAPTGRRREFRWAF
jgi:hypothetical protein